MNLQVRLKRFSLCIALASGLLLAACTGGGGSANTGAATNATNLSAAYDTNSNAVVIPLYSSLEPEVLPSEQVAANYSPMAVRTYTPAQIRAAYQMPALPSGLNYGSTSTAGLSPSQLASMGAGQTIYIIGAFDDPHIAAELDAFNQQFNLPACTSISLPVTQSLPLAAASSSDMCRFIKVYANSTASPSSAAITATAPNYDAGWATEMALDVQWAHATAPLARIILIEGVDANQNNMANAIALANKMGAGVVSMSFGGAEGNTTSMLDALFGQAGMTYVAATGDSGTAAGPMWPSVSPLVLAVGGTSLLSFGTNGRNESAWSSTGGGVSQFVSLPSYQNNHVLGFNYSKRSVADVSFNGDPYTGQYTYTIGSNNVGKWLSVGGTSLGTPQWAGIVAVLNAQKAVANQGRVGLLQSVLYPLATSGGTLWGANKAFFDVTLGSSGTFAAGVGFDVPTGLGSPNLIPLTCMVTASSTGVCSTNSPLPPPTSSPPVVSAQTINGAAGINLMFNINYSAASGDTLTWSLSNNPAGMTISPSAQVSWPTPTAGSYSVTVTATDTTNNTTGSAIYTVNISPAHINNPVSLTLYGNAGVSLGYNFPTFLSFNGDLLSYNGQAALTPTAGTTTTSVPAGLTLNNLGQLSWAQPVAGTYHVTVSALDTNTSVIYPFNLTLLVGPALRGPIIQSANFSAAAGATLSGSISITDPDNNVTRINLAIAGAPAGMQFYVYQGALAFRWPAAVAGSYTFTVTAVDVTPGHNNPTSRATETVTIH